MEAVKREEVDYSGRFKERSESIGNLVKSLIKFQTEVPVIKKESNNPYFNSKYADLASIVQTIKPTLSQNGFAYTQRLISLASDQADVQTVLLHESGEYISSSVGVKAQTPQALGSAITYARRYGLSALLGLTPDDDDDGNSASGPVAQAPKVAAATSKRVTKAKKAGFDPEDPQQSLALEKMLEKKEVAKALWPDIMDKMIGRSSKELDQIIAEISGGEA